MSPFVELPMGEGPNRGILRSVLCLHKLAEITKIRMEAIKTGHELKLTARRDWNNKIRLEHRIGEQSGYYQIVSLI